MLRLVKKIIILQSQVKLDQLHGSRQLHLIQDLLKNIRTNTLIHTKSPSNVLPTTEANSACLGKNIIRHKGYLPEVSRSVLSQNGVYKFVLGSLNPSTILVSTAKLWTVAQLDCMLRKDCIFLFWTCHLLVPLPLRCLSLSLKNSSPCGNCFTYFPFSTPFPVLLHMFWDGKKAVWSI